MADEILYGSGGGENLVVAAVASQMVMLSLADRASLRNSPQLINLGTPLIGSGAEKFATVALDGADLMVSRTEIQSIANQAFTSAQKTVTPARYGIAYDYSDYVSAIDPTGTLNPSRLAASIVASANMTFTNNLAKMVDDFATTAGATTVAMTHDTFLAAQFKLMQNKVPGSFLCILKPKQFTDWVSDLETRGGVTQWRQSTQDMQVLKGIGFQGQYNGIDVFVSDQVQSANANADWAGGMFGAGAIGFKELALGAPAPGAFIVADVGPIRVEVDRSVRTGETALVGTYYHGFVEIEDLRGVTIISAQ